MKTKRQIFLWLVLPVLALRPAAFADVFYDDFSNGINTTNWVLESNQPLYSVDTSSGNIQFSKASGGTFTFQYVALASRLVAHGNFDVRVDFTNASIARVNGTPGNQVQLDVRFGGQDFLVVRSDELAYGQNVHVWQIPPGTAGGERSWTTNFGTMRVVRSGAHVQAFVDSTLIYENDYNTNCATFVFALQNNKTKDATAVTFDNFHLTADKIGFLAPDLTIQRLPSASVVISWPDYSWPDYMAGFVLESQTNLLGLGAWQTNSGVLVSNVFSFTNPVSGPAQFFRLRQGP